MCEDQAREAIHSRQHALCEAPLRLQGSDRPSPARPLCCVLCLLRAALGSRGQLSQQGDLT